MTSPARVLVVAHKTAATPALLDAVRARAAAGPATFTLLVPRRIHGLDRVMDPEAGGDEETRAVFDLALPLLDPSAPNAREAAERLVVIGLDSGVAPDQPARALGLAGTG